MKPTQASPARASKLNSTRISARVLNMLGLSLAMVFIASCAERRAVETSKADSGMKPASAASSASMSMPMTTQAKPTAAPASNAGIQTTGELVVGLDASDPSAGTEKWKNKGSMGDFDRVGKPKVATAGGQPAVQFNGTSDAYRSEKTTPDSINGAHARSIEVWVLNPTLDANEESMVAWGHRGATLANLSFNYGAEGGFNAVTHYDQDMGWGDEAPAAGKWHLLTYTYDGKTAKIYDNGEQRGSRDFTLVTAVDKMNIAAENSTEGEPIFNSEFDQNPQMSLSGFIAVVRVESGALTPEQVKANFNAEKGRFGIGQ